MTPYYSIYINATNKKLCSNLGYGYYSRVSTAQTGTQLLPFGNSLIQLDVTFFNLTIDLRNFVIQYAVNNVYNPKHEGICTATGGSTCSLTYTPDCVDDHFNIYFQDPADDLWNIIAAFDIKYQKMVYTCIDTYSSSSSSGDSESSSSETNSDSSESYFSSSSSLSSSSSTSSSSQSVSSSSSTSSSSELESRSSESSSSVIANWSSSSSSGSLTYPSSQSSASSESSDH